MVNIQVTRYEWNALSYFRDLYLYTTCVCVCVCVCLCLCVYIYICVCVYAVARELEKLYSCLEEQPPHCHSHLSEYRRQYTDVFKTWITATLRTIQQTKDWDKITIW
jgi:hypothetical protein